MSLIPLRIWLGGTDVDIESAFRCTDGSIVSRVDWQNGYPKGTKGAGSEKDCLVRNGTGGKWVDYDCSAMKKFYCETIEGKYFSVNFVSHSRRILVLLVMTSDLRFKNQDRAFHLHVSSV